MHVIDGRIAGLRCAHIHFAEDAQEVEQVLWRYPLAEVHACSPRIALTLERWCLRVRAAGALHLDLQAPWPEATAPGAPTLLVNGPAGSAWGAGRHHRSCHAGRWGWGAWQRLREGAEVFHAAVGASQAVCAVVQAPPQGARLLQIASAGPEGRTLQAWLERVVAGMLRDAGRLHLLWCAPCPPIGPLAGGAVPLPHHRTLLLARSPLLRCLTRRQGAPMPTVSVARLPVPAGA